MISFIYFLYGLNGVRSDSMTEIEKKKEYLNSYKKKVRKLVSLRNQEKALRIELENPKAIKYNDMPSSNISTDLSDKMVTLERLQDKIQQKIEEIIILKTDIEDKVTDMEDGIESDIIRKRYIEFKDWTVICVEIGYSWKQTHRIHSNALENFKMT